MASKKTKASVTLPSPPPLVPPQKPFSSEIKGVFDMLDHNSNGKISVQEFQDALKKVNISGEISKLILNELDANKDGELDLEELTEFATKTLKSSSPESDLSQLFNYYDSEGKGYIDIKGLKSVMTILGENMDEQQLLRMFRLLDKDDDGKVSRDDFYKMMRDEIKY